MQYSACSIVLTDIVILLSGGGGQIILCCWLHIIIVSVNFEFGLKKVGC